MVQLYMKGLSGKEAAIISSIELEVALETDCFFSLSFYKSVIHVRL